MLRMYRVDCTFKENGCTYRGEWYSEDVQAESEDEAIELIKQWIDEIGGDSDILVYVAEFDYAGEC